MKLANRFVKMAVCDFCGSTLAVENNRLDPTGKTAALTDYPTRFAVGRTGRLRGKPFRVLGRVRYEDEDGYWDEWYLELEGGQIAWLEEEEGEIILSRKQALQSAVPDFEQVRVGNTLTVNGQPFFVTERCRARVAGAEGQLFFRARVGQPVWFVDGNICGRLAAIEYGDDEIEYGTGEVIAPEEIALY